MSNAGWDKLLEESEKSSKSGSGKKGSGESALYMKIKGGQKHRVRFVGDPEFVLIFWDERDPEHKKKLIVPEKYEQRFRAKKLAIRKQIAINVIDRDDEKLRFKILEKGMNIFGPVLARYAEIKDKDGKRIHPGGPNGEDWIITSDNPADKRQTKYTIVNMDRTPFSKEEKALIARGKEREEYESLPLGEQGIIPLKEIYDSKKYIEQIEEFLKELGSDADSSERISEEVEEGDEVADLTGDSLDNSPVEEDAELSDEDLDKILF